MHARQSIIIFPRVAGIVGSLGMTYPIQVDSEKILWIYKPSPGLVKKKVCGFLRETKKTKRCYSTYFPRESDHRYKYIVSSLIYF